MNVFDRCLAWTPLERHWEEGKLTTRAGPGILDKGDQKGWTQGSGGWSRPEIPALLLLGGPLGLEGELEEKETP